MSKYTASECATLRYYGDILYAPSEYYEYETQELATTITRWVEARAELDRATAALEAVDSEIEEIARRSGWVPDVFKREDV